MKSIIALALYTGLMFTSYAQKIAHINTNELVEMMPEKTAAEEELTKFKIEIESLLQELLDKYTLLMYEIEENGSTWNAVVLQMKKNELLRMEQSIQDARLVAENEFAKREQELVEPILEKAMDAINSVADEKGYDYVIDTAAGNVLVKPDNHDILDDVLKKLGLIDKK